MPAADVWHRQKWNYSNTLSECVCCIARPWSWSIVVCNPSSSGASPPAVVRCFCGSVRSEIISRWVACVAQVSIGACRVPGFICNEDGPGRAGGGDTPAQWWTSCNIGRSRIVLADGRSAVYRPCRGNQSSALRFPSVSYPAAEHHRTRHSVPLCISSCVA